jgi:hypothetical protein
LDITKIPYKGKSNISNMSIYEKNILEMFNYYNREVLKDETTPGSDNNEEQIKNIQLYNNYNIPSNNNKFDQTSFNINNLNNVSNIDINKNIIEKENTIEKNFDTNENLQTNNNFSYSVNQLQSFPMVLPPNIIQNIQNSNSLEPTDISSLAQNPNINMNNYLFNYNNLNSQNSQTKQFINYYTNNINQNKYLIQNEYEFYLMNKISYYNTILLNTIKTNQKINENILLLLGYNSNNNINANIINKSNINYNSKDKIIN